MNQYLILQKKHKMIKRKKINKIKGFSIQFLPYSEIKSLNSDERIKKILNIILKDNIILLQGKLEPEEEIKLIGNTMDMVKNNKNFKGIELAVISDNDKKDFFSRFKKNIAKKLLGGDMESVTIIGPAIIIKDIKKNPKKIELLLNK